MADGGAPPLRPFPRVSRETKARATQKRLLRLLDVPVVDGLYQLAVDQDPGWREVEATIRLLHTHRHWEDQLATIVQAHARMLRRDTMPADWDPSTPVDPFEEIHARDALKDRDIGDLTSLFWETVPPSVAARLDRGASLADTLSRASSLVYVPAPPCRVMVGRHARARTPAGVQEIVVAPRRFVSAAALHALVARLWRHEPDIVDLIEMFADHLPPLRLFEPQPFFGWLSSLERLTIPMDWTGPMLGMHCLQQLTFLDISSSPLKTIATNSFNHMSELVEFVGPAGLVEIGESTFDCCGALATVRLPPTVEVIGERAFARCRRLEEFRGPAALRRVGAGAFSGCSLLKSASFPAGVEAVASATFHLCLTLETLELTCPHVHVDPGAFDSASPFTEIWVGGADEPVSPESFGSDPLADLRR